MNASQLGAMGAGLFFLFIFLSGFWLNRSGRPYSPIILNIHKLIGLAMGIFLVMAVYRIHQVTPLGPVEVGAVVLTALLFAATVAAGGLLSIDRPMPAAISLMHKLLPVLAVLSTAGGLYLLLSHK